MEREREVGSFNCIDSVALRLSESIEESCFELCFQVDMAAKVSLRGEQRMLPSRNALRVSDEGQEVARGRFQHWSCSIKSASRVSRVRERKYCSHIG
jgi:hypothetical protein